jgi:hypothetical protein
MAGRKSDMNHRFIIKDLVVSFQKYLFAVFAFSLAAIPLHIIVLDPVWSFLNLFLSLVCLLFFFFGLLCLFGYYGIDVNYGKGTWTNYIAMLGLKLGKPETLPHLVDYVMIYEETQPAIEEMEMGSYEVSVVFDGRRKKVFLNSSSHTQAVHVSQKLAALFKTEVIDRTVQ